MRDRRRVTSPAVFRPATVSGSSAQRRDRQRQHARASLLAARHEALPAIARDAPGAARRIGDRGARGKALLAQPRQEIAGERRFAAEQMRAAGDVEKQAVRRIEADQRRVAVAPVGDGFEQTAVGLEDRPRTPAATDTSRARRRAACRA